MNNPERTNISEQTGRLLQSVILFYVVLPLGFILMGTDAVSKTISICLDLLYKALYEGRAH